MSDRPGNDPPETGRWWPDPLLISYCRNFNTRPRTVSERMWRNHTQEMYKNFSFIVTWRTKCGVMHKYGRCFLVQFCLFPQTTPGEHGNFPAFFHRTISTKRAQNVVKTKKLSPCAPSFSEILFENVDYLTRKCATWPDRFHYTESTNHPEHPCAAHRPGHPAAAAAWDTHLIIVQEAIT